MTETTTPLQPTTVEPTKLQPTTPAQPNAPTAPDSPHVTETPSPDHLLTLTDLTRQFVRRGTPFDAVSHVNLTVDAGEFIAIVGRSGNGKSTLYQHGRWADSPDLGNRERGWTQCGRLGR